MSASITNLKDENDNTLYPTTKYNAVFDNNGNTLPSTFPSDFSLDSTPTQNSTKGVQSGGVFNAISNFLKCDMGSIENGTSDGSNNIDKLVKNGVYSYYNPSNLPSGFAGWGVAIVLSGGTYKTQILIGNYNNPRIAFRNWKTDGTSAWDYWSQINSI